MFLLSGAKLVMLVCRRNALPTQAGGNKGFMTSTLASSHQQAAASLHMSRWDQHACMACTSFDQNGGLSWKTMHKSLTPSMCTHSHCKHDSTCACTVQQKLESVLQWLVPCKFMSCTILCRPTVPRSGREGGLPRLKLDAFRWLPYWMGLVDHA